MPVEAGEENIRVRVKAPGLFKKGSFRTITISKKRGIKAVIGKLKGQTNTTVQTYIFNKKKWTVAKAKKWVADRKKKKKDVQMTEELILEDEVKEKSDGKDVKHSGAQLISYIPMGATSFEDVDEYIKGEETHLRIKEVTRQFQDLVWNIMASIDIDDKQVALKSLMTELDERLGDALTLKEKSFTDKLKSWLGFEEKPEPEPEHEDKGLMIWKEGNRYRWMTTYSNKYRDEDLPPEILAEIAHETYIKEVELGVHPYPELWHWHIPGTQWGTADWLSYDKAKGFILASGWVDIGHEKEAEAIMAMEDSIKTSHSMPEEFIKREDEDKTVITGYVSREISDLPASAAANKLTGFNIEKEVIKMIPEDKKDYLRSVGLSDERIAEIEADLGAKAKQAEDAKLEFKETDEVPAEEEVAPTEEPEKEETPLEAEQSVTREEVAEAIVETVAPLQEAVAEIGKSIQELLKDDEEKIAEKAEDVPAASIAAIVARNFRAIGSDDAKLEKGAKIKGPKQEKPIKSQTGIGFIDKMIAEDEK